MVTYRTDDATRWGTGKGVNLLPSEVDGNFWELAEQLRKLTENPSTNGIASVSVSGTQMTIHLKDGTSLAPVTIPKAMIHYRGKWVAGVAYAEMDTVLADGGLFLVTRAHTSATTFDRMATNAGGERVYQWLFPTQVENAGIPEAPLDGKSYVRKNGAWVELVITETTNPATDAHSYWRLRFTPGGGATGMLQILMYQLRFYDENGAEVSMTGTATASSSETGTHPADPYTITATESDYWNFASSPSAEEWWAYQHPSPFKIRQIGLELYQDPALNCYLEYSDDGTTWSPAATVFENLATYPTLASPFVLTF